ncbi:adenylate/guanylate cyclase with integral membrane sensor [Nitzschia inconspicua]|uniref:Adenylate/guanylate cyclase with integral membrane sensor n=1 Tax=Nitzschia inconspicua TaxID=303405 RepID=A0A9K3LJL1_9STRA|nr:adenylate/guanylate cyclase with integral membrane sensor [Nitzschia inconspicua]
MALDDDATSLQNSQSESTSSKSSNVDKSSSVESSSANTGDSTKSSFTKAAKLELSGKETKYVNRLRYLILFVLTMVAIGISCLVYFLVDLATTADMEYGYERSVVHLTTAFEEIRTIRIASLASMAIATIAHGVDHFRPWPFVSLSFFQERAYIPKIQSGVLQVSIASFVSNEDQDNWEAYILSDEQQVPWIEEALAYQESIGTSSFIADYGVNWRNMSQHKIKHWSGDTVNDPAIPISMTDKLPTQYHIPFWQMSPFISFDEVNIDILQDSRGEHAIECFEQGAVVIGGMNYAPAGNMTSKNRNTATYARLLSIKANQQVDYQGDPLSNFFIPIFDSFTPERNTTAVLVGLFNWGTLFSGVLPANFGGIDVVLHNTCHESFTYNLGFNGVATPLGKGDLHDPKFDDYVHVASGLQSGMTNDGTQLGLPFANSTCQYSISIYPTQVFMDEYQSLAPVIVSIIAFVFAFTIFLFIVYDRLVEKRQAIVLQKALQSTAVVSSLFPRNVRDRILKSIGTGSPDQVATDMAGASIREKLRNSKIGQETSIGLYGNSSEPYMTRDTIADLFPNCTVLFADIAGFTAWSSSRSPEQVFTLLQNIYQAFDKIAARRKVFKVETIGDSYVAVTGLPEPQEDHAVIMAKFARDCLEKMRDVTNALEVLLGPDTTELSMRFGLNSGQVTGGVLMGERARFQLFGDTVNTAARMESTGILGKIQLSQSTAQLLTAAGKGTWIHPREDVVTAKGKGAMQTYWLITKSSSQNEGSNNMAGTAAGVEVNLLAQESVVANKLLPQNVGNSDKAIRMIGWMSEVLLDYVKQIVAKNMAAGISSSRGCEAPYQPQGSICLDEVVESFNFIKVTREEKQIMREKYLSVELSEDVVNQVRLYVQKIAALYNGSNPFHNFDHACHVTMSVHKLMKRVVTDGTYSEEGIIPSLEHERKETYGILTSDPLTLFAIVFSALIHDVDHPGVSNVQLAKESPEIADHYRNKSIAEQKSFDISWDLLMEDEFKALRRAIFPRHVDMCRFRQVVVNIVLATDIFDKEMGDMRKERWEKVFGTNVSNFGIGDDEKMRNTRATIVLEHIIQASDVSHTMQHWHVYVKWNKRLFEEMSLAFAEGRMGSDPAAFWFQGELSFLDNYVIPLAKKIGECGVFGVSSDEYLNYAISNRREWEVKGMGIVEDMVASLQNKSVTDSA